MFTTIHSRKITTSDQSLKCSAICQKNQLHIYLIYSGSLINFARRKRGIFKEKKK